MEIDEHAAPLHAGGREIFHAQLVRAEPLFRILGTNEVHTAAPAVVIDLFRHAIAVGVEHLPDMAQTVPLRGILQVEEDGVVADDVAIFRADVRQLEVEIIGRPAALLVLQLRRLAMREDRIAAGIVERQRQGEGEAFLHFSRSGHAPLRGQQVHLAALIVVAETAPVRSLGLVDPTFGGHSRFLCGQQCHPGRSEAQSRDPERCLRRWIPDRPAAVGDGGRGLRGDATSS